MSDHPLDIVISRLGEGYYVGPRDQRRMGMRFDKHSEAVKWAHGIAMGRQVIDKTKRLAFAPYAESRRTRTRATRAVLVDTPCGVLGLPDGRSVSTSRGRELARRVRTRRR